MHIMTDESQRFVAQIQTAFEAGWFAREPGQ
jgi:hypothetical protein